jgi:hypothetical protein
MTPATVHALADHLAAIDTDWRKANGYTGRAVHKRGLLAEHGGKVVG